MGTYRNTSPKKHPAKAITIECLIKDYNLDVIDILKLNIECAEVQLFRSDSISIDKVRSIAVDLHEWKKKGCNAAFIKIARNFDEVCQVDEYFYLSKGGFILMD